MFAMESSGSTIATKWPSRLKRFFQKELVRAQQDQEQFIPLIAEAGFGTHDGKFPAIKIRFKGRDLTVRGKIDRVDVAQHTVGSESPRMRVIDYKSGSTAISKDRGSIRAKHSVAALRSGCGTLNCSRQQSDKCCLFECVFR